MPRATCVYCWRESTAEPFVRSGWHCPHCERDLVALCDALDRHGRPTLAWTFAHAADDSLQRLWNAAGTTGTLARLVWLSGFYLVGVYDLFGRQATPDEIRARFPRAPTLSAVLDAITRHPNLRRAS